MTYDEALSLSERITQEGYSVIQLEEIDENDYHIHLLGQDQQLLVIKEVGEWDTVYTSTSTQEDMSTAPQLTPIFSVRGIDPDLVLRIKLAAVKTKRRIGAIVTEALEEWLQYHPTD